MKSNIGSKFDVIVVGAGPAGATIAKLLSQMGFSVLIVRGKSSSNRFYTAESLSPQAVARLINLGYGHVVNDPRIARNCIGIKAIWHTAKVEFRDYFTEHHLSGAIINRAKFDDEILNGACIAGGTLENNLNITNVVHNAESIQLSGFQDKSNWNCRAKFVVDASGKSAVVARKLGVDRERFTQQKAIAIDLAPSSREIPHHAWLWIEGNGFEWWSAAVGPSGGRHLVRFSSNLAAESPCEIELMKLARQTQLIKYFIEENELDHEKLCGLDAGTSALKQVVGARWIAIGDASISFDPIASQGLTHALGSALAGAEAIQRFFTTGNSDGLVNYGKHSQITLRHHLTGLAGHYLNQHSWMKQSNERKYQNT